MKKLLIIASTFALGSFAHGQVLQSADFESFPLGPLASAHQGFNYGFATPPTLARTIEDNGGDKYFRLSIDYPADAQNWAAQTVDIFSNSSEPSVAVFAGTTDLSLIQVSFSVRATGNSSGNVVLNMNLLNTGFAQNPGARFIVPVTNGAWTNFSATLDTAVVLNDGWTPAAMGATNTIQSFFEVQASRWGGPDSTGNVFELNNFTMQVVPEPSTYAFLLGAVVLGFALWRRRL